MSEKSDYLKFKKYILSVSKDEREAIVNQNYKDFMPSIPDCDSKPQFMLELLKRVNTEEQIETGDGSVWFNPTDIQILLDIDDAETRKYMACLIAQVKRCPHKNGWIEFDFPRLLGFAFNTAEFENVSEYDLKKCSKYGLRMSVVGKNKPKLCFKIDGVVSEKIIYAVEVKNYAELEAILTSQNAGDAGTTTTTTTPSV